MDESLTINQHYNSNIKLVNGTDDVTQELYKKLNNSFKSIIKPSPLINQEEGKDYVTPLHKLSELEEYTNKLNETEKNLKFCSKNLDSLLKKCLKH